MRRSGLLVSKMLGEAAIIGNEQSPVEQPVQAGFQTARRHRRAMFGNLPQSIAVSNDRLPFAVTSARQRESDGPVQIEFSSSPGNGAADGRHSFDTRPGENRSKALSQHDSEIPSSEDLRCEVGNPKACSRTIYADRVPGYATLQAANWSRSNFCSDTYRSRLRNLGCEQRLREAVNDGIGIEPMM